MLFQGAFKTEILHFWQNQTVGFFSSNFIFS